MPFSRSFCACSLDFSRKVSPGSESFNRKLLPCVIRKVSANLPGFIPAQPPFASCIGGQKAPRECKPGLDKAAARCASISRSCDSCTQSRERAQLRTCAIGFSPLLVVLDDSFGHGLGRTV